jgi:hypothetical protein
MLAPALALVSAASCKRDFITFPCLCPTSPTQQAFDTASSWLYSFILNSVLAEFASPPPFTHPCCPHRPSRRPPAPPLSSPPLQAPNPRPHLAPPPRVPPAIRGTPDRPKSSSSDIYHVTQAERELTPPRCSPPCLCQSKSSTPRCAPSTRAAVRQYVIDTNDTPL